MSMSSVRICMALAIIIILLSGHFFLLAYVAVFHVSVEFLNSRKGYTARPEHRRYNTVFVGFVLFIVLNRGRGFRFDEQVEYILNLVEHGMFALVICLNLLCYLELWGKWSHRTRMLAVVIAFNVIGVANEVFQNAMNERALLIMEADGMKDIAVNAVGSLIFLLVVKRRSDLRSPVDLVGSARG